MMRSFCVETVDRIHENFRGGFFAFSGRITEEDLLVWKKYRTPRPCRC